MNSVTTYLNISAYKFVSVSDAADLRQSVCTQASSFDLKGTVLIAEEGINLFLAGLPNNVRSFVSWLRADRRFADLEVRISESRALPFGRLEVKIKAEIIRMNSPQIRPQVQRAPAVRPGQLALWLDQGHDDAGRQVLMLDTRNAFEVDAGQFEGALDWRLQRFSDFPAALRAHADALLGKTVVSYCTGGIRCEKAALWAAQSGMPHVRQLDGGILRYFEATPGAPHWRGRCVVFDERGALAPDRSAEAIATG